MAVIDTEILDVEANDTYTPFVVRPLSEPIKGEDIDEPGVRTPKPLRNLGWDDFAPGEVRHEWAEEFKRPPKADKLHR